MRQFPKLVSDLENDFLYNIQKIPNEHCPYFSFNELKSFLEDGIKIYSQESYVMIYAAVRALRTLVFHITMKKPRILAILKDNVEPSKECFLRLINDYNTILEDYVPPFPEIKFLVP